MTTRFLNYNDQHWLLADNESIDQDASTPIIWPAKRLAEIQVQSRQNLAIWLDADDSADLIADVLDQIAFVGLSFPAYKDGRPYSTAATLRRQYGFEAPIIAFGDVRPDQLEQMKRCGIDHFWLADDQLLFAASVQGYSHHYQSAPDKSKALFESQKLESQKLESQKL